MKRSLFLSAVMAACAIAGSSMSFVTAPLANAYRFVVSHAVKACALAGPMAEIKPAKLVAFVKAKAFAKLLAKRERPVLSSSWRMCPLG